MNASRFLIYLLFFASGMSGLIYEVVWVRQFGLLFGSTVYSAALVTSIYMLGLGVGSYLAGRWVDRRGRTHPPRSFHGSEGDGSQPSPESRQANNPQFYAVS